MKKQVAQERFGGYIFLLPALILLGLFLFLPTLLSIYYSFTDYYMLTPQDRSFIGIGNYITLFKDPLFIKSLWNIGKFVIFIMPIQVGTALGLALLVNKKRKGNTFFKIAFFAPVVMSLVVVSVLWLYLLNPTDGLINALLLKVGINAQPFLTSPKQAMFVIIAISAWQGAGYQMLIFLAGLQNIPSEIYEAARIDGANKWEQFRNVTLPMLKPTSVMILTTTLIDAFKLIIQPMVMTQGGPLNSTITPVYYIYRSGFTDRHVGYASAITVIYGGVIIIFSLLQRRVTGGRNND
ncbi:sugar ABC transporter permease [Vagococcus lutrae]|uniref:Sugar ABC transporter permease n=1 Tax=Vagococcus lutrae TaxID=81947 RepID=A0AAF0BHP2_9ENTE|nr:sugar ABC transporter permease [Vagococcus lutrae]RST93810.1 ABC transporter permease [Vagococcus lutrae]UQF37540.1 sugar ABC transporter permease [Vagococcus lutrae]WCG22685.1 sugar ABC transporter permease [Vagococcus lutrae]